MHKLPNQNIEYLKFESGSQQDIGPSFEKSSRLNVLFYNQTGGVGLRLVQGLTLVVAQAKNLTLNETFLDLIIESFLLSELSKSLVPSLLVSKLAL